jgi:hypothetical protein
MEIKDRYARAIRSTKLAPKPNNDHADIDVLGAAGLAAKTNALCVAMMRLLSGDNHAARDVIEVLAEKATSKAHYTGMEPPLKHLQARALCANVLDWYRHGTCRACEGRRQSLIPGTPMLSGLDCTTCRGTGKQPFEQVADRDRRELALWVRDEVERAVALAGPAVMRRLAPQLDL